MHRSLRFQLIASVVGTLVVVLGISQWLGTHLAERALEEDLRARAMLVVETVSSLWDPARPQRLRRHLAPLIGHQRPIRAIDVFELRNGQWVIGETTRKTGRKDEGGREQSTVPVLSAQEQGQLLEAKTVSARLPDGQGWKLAVPFISGRQVAGAVQVEVRPAAFRHLEGWLRLLDGLFLVGSVVLLSAALAFLLERRVTRPITALVSGMRRAESGDLAARVSVSGEGELQFLARTFNRMLSRIEELTIGLEARVERATQDLAAKNRELQAANAKLAAAQLEVSRAERLAAHGQMAATIAHELGTPLNSVLGYTQLLLRDEPVAERADKLAIIESQVQRMAETIRSVLDRARSRAIEHAPVAVEELVAQSLTFVSHRIGERGLTVRSEIPEGLPAVPGDATGLRQVLVNLLTNAIDATEPPGTITVSAEVLSPNGSQRRQVELRVQDTGRGMTPDELRSACQPYYTTKAPGYGTGLGLVIADHIVRAHRGRLILQSVAREGTTAHVQLPLEL